jgi:hypothetical protein
MTHTVAATTSAATTADTHRAAGARAASTSFAEVQAAAVKTADSGSSDTKSTSSTAAPKGEKTQAVEGHSYKEIVSGPRNGMFINNTGNKRDGEAFLIVKRHNREFHIYGSGDDRKVYEVGRAREDDNGASGTTTDSSSSGTTSGSGTTGASTTGTSGTGSTS